MLPVSMPYTDKSFTSSMNKSNRSSSLKYFQLTIRNKKIYYAIKCNEDCFSFKIHVTKLNIQGKNKLLTYNDPLLWPGVAYYQSLKLH